MAKIWFEGALATYLVVSISPLYTYTIVRENPKETDTGKKT